MTKNKKKSQLLSLPRRLLEGLSEANRLVEQSQFQKALPILQELDSQYPNQYEVLVLLIEVSYEIQASVTYEWAVYRLWRLKPGSLEITTNLAAAYMLTNRPGLALRTFNTILKRWPNPPQLAEIRKTMEELRAYVLNDIQYPGLDEAELLELAATHDEVRFLMQHGQYHQGKNLAEKLLKTYPGLVPVMNNLAQMYLMEGNPVEARRLSIAVLEIDPENIHALAQTTRLLFLAGDFAGARAMAQRQADSSSQAPERWARLAATYAMLDESQRLVEVYEQAEQAGGLNSSPETALVLHLAAVALARLGHEPRARKLWKKAIQILPTFDLPRENLADLDLPAGQRNGPWAYNLSFWMPPPVIQEMSTIMAAPVKSQTIVAIESAARKFLQLHPELLALLPDMLARGNTTTRQFAIQFIKISEIPELLDLLKDFVLSDRGTDELRQDTMRYLLRKGHLPAGSYRMWFDGEWKDLLQSNFEITEKHTPEFQSREAEKLAGHALRALRARDAAHAQDLLQQALAIEETPSLLNNLALALEMQGQTKKAHAIAESVHARFPDYFFGIIAAANKATALGDLDEAKKLLDDLSLREKMHITEYTALCEAQIRLAFARKNDEVAKSWLGLWEKVYPDDPNLVSYKLILSGPTLLDRMRKSLKR
ncbi:MAG: hypothetical protein EHM81_01860 [Chloroflexi bacterium]|nr:MAG: hypothetical protein EHM81_01860 [Chloroflexota bacterium]